MTVIRRDLTQYFGAESSAVGMLLFFLGVTGLLISLLAVLSGFSLRDGSRYFLAIPIWSIVATPLGLLLRRAGAPAAVVVVAKFWLFVAFGGIFLASFLR